MIDSELYELLEEKVQQYNIPAYIESDPIQIPHRFSKTENIEISAFLCATIAWGNRKSIIKNASEMMLLFENDPYEFLCNAGRQDMKRLESFKHRTFNGQDLTFFVNSLRNIYTKHGGLSHVFETGYKKKNSVMSALSYFRAVFFEIEYPLRTQKHIANINKNSSCKRLNMMLRWLVRKDNAGVDFGIWDFIPMSNLYIPLDVHVGNIARQLGLLQRTGNDWKAVEELQRILCMFDPNDPCKYDYALFGIGVFEK